MPRNTNRDDFSPQVKRDLAARVNYCCSNPDCRAPTSGPQNTPDKAVNIGVAAHIAGAARGDGSPRFDPNMTSAQRSDIQNGIWLCQNCAKLIDSDWVRFTSTLLHAWKSQAEADAQKAIGKPNPQDTSTENTKDKFVGLSYPDKAGITENLRSQGYRVFWCNRPREAEMVEFEGWEYVIVEQPNGERFRLKISDPTAGGYLVLLKKKEN